MKRNKFKRALHHLNKKHVVESAPTNNSLGVFSVTPSGVGPVGWTDREFTTDISGNPLPKKDAADFTIGENPADSTEAKDTSGLFEDDGVTVKTQTPPGDNSYILGPFSSMWYAWGNFTTLGYIEEGTRKMRNLGTITGKLSDWDGSSINSYGQLTLEQALWFRDVDKFGGIDNDPANHNFRAFYPGPPSNTPDAFGRYLCVIAAGREVGGTETRPGAPENPTEKGEMNPDDNFSMSQYFSKKNEKGDPFGAPDGYDPINDINEFLPPDPDYDVDKQKEDAENIDKIYDEWKSRYDKNFNADGSEKTPEQKFDDFRRGSLPKWANDMEDWAKNLPWNNPNNPVGKFINNNSWWIEPVIGAIAGAKGAKNAYKAPYKISNTKVNSWKNSTPTKHTSGSNKGKYKNIELFNNKGDLIGKKYKENGQWKTKMRPTNKTSAKDKIDWEIDQLQHTNKSFNNYYKTGKNPNLKDLDPFRLTKVEPGSTFVKGADGKIRYSGGTVGANWALNKAAGAGLGAAAGAAMGSDDNQSNASTRGTPDPDGIIRNPGQPQVGGTAAEARIDVDISKIEVRLAADAATNVNRSQSEIDADKREIRKLQQRKENMESNRKALNARRAKGEYVDPAEYKNLEVKPSIKLKTPNAVNKNNNKNDNKNNKKDPTDPFEDEIKPDLKVKDGDKLASAPNMDLYNWMLKTYGMPAAEWKLNNPGLPDSSNPHLRPGSYVPKAQKKTNKKRTMVAHYQPKRKILTEIRKPTIIPEEKKKFKVKPRVLGHPSNKTLSNQMKDTTPNVAFKKEIPVWSMDQKMRNARLSQAKKNEVLEYLGSSGDHWNYMTKTIKEHNKKIINLNYGGKNKKVTRKEQVDKDTLVFMEDEFGNKSSVLQSKINEMQAEAGDKEMFAKYYEMNPQKKSLFKEVVKRGVFDYKGKPSKKGYPDKEPAQLDPKTGMHPDYGKKYKYDKLDPHSAESMPMQGNQEIDTNIARKVNPESKKRKTKILNQPNG